MTYNVMLWSQMSSLAKSDDVHQDCRMSFIRRTLHIISAVSTTKSAAPYSLLHLVFRRRSEIAMNTPTFLTFQRTVFSYACLSHDICYVRSTSGTEWLIQTLSSSEMRRQWVQLPSLFLSGKEIILETVSKPKKKLLTDLASALGSSTSVIWATCYCDVWTNKQRLAHVETSWVRTPKLQPKDPVASRGPKRCRCRWIPTVPHWILHHLIHASIIPSISHQTAFTIYNLTMDGHPMIQLHPILTHLTTIPAIAIASYKALNVS